MVYSSKLKPNKFLHGEEYNLLGCKSSLMSPRRPELERKKLVYKTRKYVSFERCTSTTGCSTDLFSKLQRGFYFEFASPTNLMDRERKRGRNGAQEKTGDFKTMNCNIISHFLMHIFTSSIWVNPRSAYKLSFLLFLQRTAAYSQHIPHSDNSSQHSHY